MNYDRLIEYLEAVDDSWGCISRYESKKFGDAKRDWACVAGHYGGIVSDIVNLLGRDRLLTLARTIADIEKTAKNREGE